MRKIIESLIALQRLQLDRRAQTVASQAEIEKLREEVPQPILAHYERLVARGKKGVALVRSGVCSECNLRITLGKLAALSAAADIQLCDNCGRYLYAEETASGFTDAKTLPSAAVKPTPKKAAPRVH